MPRPKKRYTMDEFIELGTATFAPYIRITEAAEKVLALIDVYGLKEMNVETITAIEELRHSIADQKTKSAKVGIKK